MACIHRSHKLIAAFYAVIVDAKHRKRGAGLKSAQNNAF